MICRVSQNYRKSFCINETHRLCREHGVGISKGLILSLVHNGEYLDTTIANTYVAKSKSDNPRAVYDSYIKAFRWATDCSFYYNRRKYYKYNTSGPQSLLPTYIILCKKETDFVGRLYYISKIVIEGKIKRNENLHI